jgi:hypothetical protein
VGYLGQLAGEMTDDKRVLRIIQSHRSLINIDYSLVVNWALDLVQQGKETENILILASFSEPIDKYEITPHITRVLNELGLEELTYDNPVQAQTHYHLMEILSDQAIRINLSHIYHLFLRNNHPGELLKFYLFYHAWDELDNLGVNFYFPGADKDNIQEVLKQEATKWIDKYINKKEC